MKGNLEYDCPVCEGDGKATCHNPDHWYYNRLPHGCPACGHDEYHKIPNGGSCEGCIGIGRVDKETFHKLNDEYGFKHIANDFINVSGITIIMP